MRVQTTLLCLALVALLGVAAPAKEFDADYVHGSMHKPSDQPGGQACWPYLRSPLRTPADPCCERCQKGGNCKVLDRPRGTSGLCWGSQDEACFWKRHAWSWGIKCSECWADTECDLCDELIGGRDPKILQVLENQIAIEGGSEKRPLWIAVSPHFYVVTDIHRKLKVPTEGGAPRVASGHEVAHLYAQRCELAYNDFVHYFGGRVQPRQADGGVPVREDPRQGAGRGEVPGQPADGHAVRRRLEPHRGRLRGQRVRGQPAGTARRHQPPRATAGT